MRLGPITFLSKGCRLNLTLHNARVTYYSQPNFGRSLKKYGLSTLNIEMSSNIHTQNGGHEPLW